MLARASCLLALHSIFSISCCSAESFFNSTHVLEEKAQVKILTSATKHMVGVACMGSCFEVTLGSTIGRSDTAVFHVAGLINIQGGFDEF